MRISKNSWTDILIICGDFLLIKMLNNNYKSIYRQRCEYIIEKGFLFSYFNKFIKP